MSVDAQVADLFPESRAIGVELYIPVRSAALALDFFEKAQLAVFRIETFIVEDEAVKPIHSEILDVYGSKDREFSDFLTYSIAQSRNFVDHLQSSSTGSKELYVNFLYDDSLE